MFDAATVVSEATAIVGGCIIRVQANRLGVILNRFVVILKCVMVIVFVVVSEAAAVVSIAAVVVDQGQILPRILACLDKGRASGDCGVRIN